MTRTISTACCSVTALASSRGAVPKASPATAGLVRSGCLIQSTNAATPAWATSPSQDRFSADMARNQGSRRSIDVIAAVPSAPMAWSSRAIVSARTRPPSFWSGSGWLAPFARDVTDSACHCRRLRSFVGSPGARLSADELIAAVAAAWGSGGSSPRVGAGLRCCLRGLAGHLCRRNLLVRARDGSGEARPQQRHRGKDGREQQRRARRRPADADAVHDRTLHERPNGVADAEGDEEEAENAAAERQRRVEL